MSRETVNQHQLAVVNDAGDIEVIDMHTGELVLNNRANAPAMHEFAFNYNKALLILQEIREGKTLNDICLMPNMPPLHILQHWQRTDRMFAEEMKLARIARADFHHEKVLDLAQKAAKGLYSKDEVPSIKLGAELYRWSAERANPDKYGNKITHEGSAEKPILMRVINTGINRAQPISDVVEAEHKEIIDDTEKRTESSKLGETSDEDGEGEDY